MAARLFCSQCGEPALERQEKQDLATLKRGFDQLNREIPFTMVMSEMAKPRDTFVLKRGDYRNPTDKGIPNTPDCFAGAAE